LREGQQIIFHWQVKTPKPPLCCAYGPKVQLAKAFNNPENAVVRVRCNHGFGTGDARHEIVVVAIFNHMFVAISIQPVVAFFAALARILKTK